MKTFLREQFRLRKVQLSLVVKRFPVWFYVLKWLLVSAVISIPIGSASAFFLVSLQWATDMREANEWIIFFLPLGGLAIGSLYHYWGKNVEAGNNLLIDTIHLPNKERIPFRMMPFVLFGTVATHFFGGSAGREGTALQMAGAIADQFTRPLRLTLQDRKLLLISAVSAGFGSVFGTPLAGAVFGLEFFLIGRIRYEAILPAFLGAFFADMVTHAWQVPHTHYHMPEIVPISPLNILWSVAAGILFGLCARIFSTSIHFVGKFFKTNISFPPLRPLVGGCILLLIVLLLDVRPYLGLGIPTIVASFESELPFYDFALKIALTVLTLGAGFKGGEVTPLFFIGATLGNALSVLIPLPTGMLAGMGFVAVFAGAANTPLACLLMGLELFGMEAGAYLAIACIVSYLFSGHSGIYASQIIGSAKHHRWSSSQGKRLAEIKEEGKFL